MTSRMFIGFLLIYVILGGLLADRAPHPPEPGKLEEMVDVYLRAIT